MRLLLVVSLLLLGACQITIDPSVDGDYFGMQATFTVSPNVMAEDPYDSYEPPPAATDEEQQNDADSTTPD